MDVELDDIPVHSLVPEALRDVASVDEFMARLPDFDGELAEQLSAADAAGECLRFVGARIPLPDAAKLCASHACACGELGLLLGVRPGLYAEYVAWRSAGRMRHCRNPLCTCKVCAC